MRHTMYHVSMTKLVFVLFGECSTSINYMHMKDKTNMFVALNIAEKSDRFRLL